MIKTGTQLDSKRQDDSSELDTYTLALVQHAMSNGLTHFTTPTSADDEQRIDWEVVNWAVMVEEGEGKDKKKRPACFLVARKVTMAHFEVVGPEIKFGGK
jgi:hypothetical protein